MRLEDGGARHPPAAMHLRADQRGDLLHRVAHPQQDQFRPISAVDAQIMVLHFQRDDVEAEAGRQAAQQRGAGIGNG